ncbi:hypothetical protein CORC01_06403 [Colletotrichum orchidophilum]|uniref:Uncharacterized protein n=1 Tax=Colletotrichum orchidophilum TaxID=1209926 RepID=A0A1G4BA67_9PEZI|nr:uncharacterized protein CORC01_06403 [Colletotrichum orchidophilum]OHE98206.1 hypothetical protein CORC01_06403 [Colletotrichum orchidophilum]
MNFQFHGPCDDYFGVTLVNNHRLGPDDRQYGVVNAGLDVPDQHVVYCNNAKVPSDNDRVQIIKFVVGRAGCLVTMADLHLWLDIYNFNEVLGRDAYIWAKASNFTDDFNLRSERLICGIKFFRQLGEQRPRHSGGHSSVLKEPFLLLIAETVIEDKMSSRKGWGLEISQRAFSNSGLFYENGNLR